MYCMLYMLYNIQYIPEMYAKKVQFAKETTTFKTDKIRKVM